jgi:4-amino-4-deoxy-L-arabinose transferase-like glycosyltransferase
MLCGETGKATRSFDLISMNEPDESIPWPRRLQAMLVAGLFALIAFGSVWPADKPLSMHEARLPQLSREMSLGGSWIIPQSGGRPWTERPPLPQWITALAIQAHGERPPEWVVRIPPVVMGVITCMLVAGIACRITSSTRLGILAGIALATMYEFMIYATLAEDEVFLAALVALAWWAFVEALHDARRRWVWGVVFFLALALTHLVRGPMVGMSQVGAGVGAYLLTCALGTDARGARLKALFQPFGWAVWIVGLLLALVLGLSWWVHGAMTVPGFRENLAYDFFSGFGADPWWYYGLTLLWTTQPWTIPIIVALIWAVRRCRHDRSARLVLCLAVAPVLLMSIPERKHHHYLVPLLGAWAILGSIGMSLVWKWGCSLKPRPVTVTISYAAAGVLAGAGAFVGVSKLMPGVSSGALLTLAIGLAAGIAGFGVAAARRHAVGATIAFASAFAVVSGFFQIHYNSSDPRRLADRAFAQRVERETPVDAPLLIVQKESLDFFLLQFYIRPEARLLHNNTFLKSDRITAPTVYVVTRAADRPFIDTLGTVQEVFRADYSRRERGPDWRWTLYRLTFRPDLSRYPEPAIDAAQAMRRPDGIGEAPYLGEAP